MQSQIGNFTRILLLIAAITAVRAHVKGAPYSACVTMTPKHRGIKAQTTAAPYTISIRSAQGKNIGSGDSVRAGDLLTLRICGRTAADTYRGFLVEGRRADNPSDTTVLGRFIVKSCDTSMHSLNCGNANSAVTHSNALAKGVQCRTFTWQVPSDVEGSVHFLATIAREFSIFWVAIPSVSFRICGE